MNPDLERLKAEVAALTFRVNELMKPHTYTFEKPINAGANGLLLNLLPSQKIGLNGKTPIVQWSSGTGRANISTDSGPTAHLSTQWDGDLGGTGYGVGDIVAFLKTRGDIAS